MKISWCKVLRGSTVQWIDANITSNFVERTVVVSIPAEKFKEVATLCRKWLEGPGMIKVSELRPFCGKGS